MNPNRPRGCLVGVEVTPEAPIRQKSAKGQPKPLTSISRTCQTCGACFIGLAFGKTGQRGIWNESRWFCSIECTPKRILDELKAGGWLS